MEMLQVHWGGQRQRIWLEGAVVACGVWSAGGEGSKRGRASAREVKERLRRRAGVGTGTYRIGYNGQRPSLPLVVQIWALGCWERVWVRGRQQHRIVETRYVGRSSECRGAP